MHTNPSGQDIARRLKSAAISIGCRRVLKEASLLTFAYFLYMITRKLVFEDVEAVATANALKLISLQKSLGFFWELDLQRWLLDGAHQVIVFFNWSYILTFFPIIIPTGIILYKTNLKKYIYYRNIILLSLFIAVVVYALFPLAPPRMISGTGIVDTIQSFGPAQYNSREAQFYYNAFAAMPSIHFGWTVLFGVMFFSTGILWLRILGVLYPTITFFAIVATGNHYIMDAIGGAGVIAIAFLINRMLIRKNLPLSPSLLYIPVRALVQRRLRSDRVPFD
ncbi:MAG: phosphatase PAP2 family protein [Chloroflexi bacterium]|nr:phosphatase PAP2 family protein [Chloroflexota bacterium]